MNRLIADAGSTKTEWAFISDDGSAPLRLCAEGVNVSLESVAILAAKLAEVARVLVQGHRVDAVDFYGAGCAGDAVAAFIPLLRDAFGTADVSVSSDLEGAAKATLGRRPGVVCILGTGSNSGLYDGSRITRNIHPMGYILGDEGSGAALGKRLLGDVFKGIAPARIVTAFDERYRLSYGELVRRVYKEPEANRYLASFAKFLAEHIDDEYVAMLVSEEMRRFVVRNLLQYGSSCRYSFVGSVADAFSRQLSESMMEFGLGIDSIVKNPIDGLVKYYRDEK